MRLLRGHGRLAQAQQHFLAHGIDLRVAGNPLLLRLLIRFCAEPREMLIEQPLSHRLAPSTALGEQLNRLVELSILRRLRSKCR